MKPPSFHVHSARRATQQLACSTWLASTTTQSRQIALLPARAGVSLERARGYGAAQSLRVTVSGHQNGKKSEDKHWSKKGPRTRPPPLHRRSEGDTAASRSTVKRCLLKWYRNTATFSIPNGSPSATSREAYHASRPGAPPLLKSNRGPYLQTLVIDNNRRGRYLLYVRVYVIN